MDFWNKNRVSDRRGRTSHAKAKPKDCLRAGLISLKHVGSILEQDCGCPNRACSENRMKSRSFIEIRNSFLNLNPEVTHQAWGFLMHNYQECSKAHVDFFFPVLSYICQNYTCKC